MAINCTLNAALIEALWAAIATTFGIQDNREAAAYSELAWVL